jgi:hypothetical protein
MVGSLDPASLEAMIQKDIMSIDSQNDAKKSSGQTTLKDRYVNMLINKDLSCSMKVNIFICHVLC